MIYATKISNFLTDLASMFLGNYTPQNPEVTKMKDDIFDIYHTPTTAYDKQFLKNDLNIFLSDTQKAHKSIKKEVSYGKAK